MAPECFNGLKCLKSDIWSAGVIMYYLIEGKLPFKGDTNNQLIKIQDYAF